MREQGGLITAVEYKVSKACFQFFLFIYTTDPCLLLLILHMLSKAFTKSFDPLPQVDHPASCTCQAAALGE